MSKSKPQQLKIFFLVFLGVQDLWKKNWLENRGDTPEDVSLLALNVTENRPLASWFRALFKRPDAPASLPAVLRAGCELARLATARWSFSGQNIGGRSWTWSACCHYTDR